MLSVDSQCFKAGVLAAVVAGLLSLPLAMAPVAQAGSCGWGPFSDVAAAQKLLQQWAADTGLPAFDKDESGLGVDHERAQLKLQFGVGSLSVAWSLDADCAATAITIESSADYTGVRPDEHAVERLVVMLGTVVPQQRQEDSNTPWVVLGAVGLLLGALLLLARLGVPRVPDPRNFLPILLARARALPTSSWMRLLGIVLIIACLPYQSASAGDWLRINRQALVAVLPLIAFLWLVVAGSFGYGPARRDDWPLLLPFLFALAIREGYARHGVEGNVLHFVGKGFDSHSFVYSLYLMFLEPLARDAFKLQMHSNGVLGAVAALPLGVFIRQRTGSIRAAVLVATFYAVHPILVQMAPTDSPYSLCFATWFAGLTLLATPDMGARHLVGAAGLLGIAATCRPEGGLLLVASLLLIDVGAVWRALRLHPLAGAVALAVGSGMLALEVYFIFSTHMTPGSGLPVDTFSAFATLKAGLWSTDYNDLLIVILVLVGALAGLANKQLRIGLGAAVGTLLVVWPFCQTTFGGYTILHRLSGTCALHVIAAGIGAAWLTSWLPTKLRRHWASVLPGVFAALYLLVVHRHEIHEQHGLSDELWMLRNHLAPGGTVKKECTLVWVGRSMDTDIHNFGDVLPGMQTIQCQQSDCLAEIAKGGCFYYIRGLNCFHSETPTKVECRQSGKTAAGGYMDCIEADCVRVETSLHLELLEQRTVDVHTVWNYEQGKPPDPHFPVEADVALYRVLGLKH